MLGAHPRFVRAVRTVAADQSLCVLGSLLERHSEFLSEAEALVGADRAEDARVSGPSIDDVAQAVCSAVG